MGKREKLLPTKETAERLGAGESSIRFWCDTGRFPEKHNRGLKAIKKGKAK